MTVVIVTSLIVTVLLFVKSAVNVIVVVVNVLVPAAIVVLISITAKGLSMVEDVLRLIEIGELMKFRSGTGRIKGP